MAKQRNRHTGRVNAAKSYVLRHGKRATASDGRIYAYVSMREGGMIVRDFEAERARAATA